MSPRLIELGALAGIALAIGGCTTLGGNVKGEFACRAPEGSCAPTSAIDEQATKALQPQGANASSTPPPNDRTLRVVLAAWRDANGREHEARVVHVPLAEKPASNWRAPLSTGDVLRALGRASQSQTGPLDTGDATGTATVSSSLPQQLPDVLVIPSQGASELPGASAPATGAPGRPPSPGRVPHPVSPEGEKQ
jgi:conjugal transfer pilus assembly protein TraV